MKQRRYALQVGGTGRDVELSRPWQNAFLPGQRIEMSFMFEDRSGGNTCPGCQNPSEHPAEVDTRCSTCGLSFRRVEEVQDIGRPEEVTAPPNDFESFNREPTSLHDFIDHEDITDFKRVRLVRKLAVTAIMAQLVRSLNALSVAINLATKASHGCTGRNWPPTDHACS